MKRAAWFLVVFLMLLAVLSPVIAYAATTTLPPPPSSHPPPSNQVPNCGNPCTITIRNSQFGDSSGATNPYIVAAGTTAIWQNEDSTQNIIASDNGLFQSRTLNYGDTFNFTFSTPGIYTYHSVLHPMTGEIIVVSAA